MSELTRRYVVMSLATAAPFDVDDHDGVFVSPGRIRPRCAR